MRTSSDRGGCDADTSLVVVGEMTWNPVKLRWEGNETALRDFDNIPISTSARPALITHISNPASPTAMNLLPGGIGHRSGSSSSSSILGSVNTGGSRIVGDMRFDPKEMRWISLSPDEEPDPFEGMADDEDEDELNRGGTIRARKLVAIGLSEASESLWSSSRKASVISSGTTSASTSGDSTSSYHTSQQHQQHQSHHDTITTTTATPISSVHHTNTNSNTYPSITVTITEALKLECKEAEDRHKKEMRGWISGSGSWSRSEARREEKRLWDIRYLALKS